ADRVDAGISAGVRAGLLAGTGFGLANAAGFVAIVLRTPSPPILDALFTLAVTLGAGVVVGVIVGTLLVTWRASADAGSHLLPRPGSISSARHSTARGGAPLPTDAAWTGPSSSAGHSGPTGGQS